MAKVHFSGPIKAGPIQDTIGTSLGTDVANVGYVKMIQSAAVTQAGTETAAGTGIVIPANSQIISVRLFKTVAWNGAAATFNLGTSATATELAVAAGNTGANIGYTEVSPTTDATRVGNWIDVGTSDVEIYMLSTNTGDGVGILTVEYAQAINLS
jgi:hypothetical protein